MELDRIPSVIHERIHFDAAHGFASEFNKDMPPSAPSTRPRTITLRFSMTEYFFFHFLYYATLAPFSPLKSASMESLALFTRASPTLPLDTAKMSASAPKSTIPLFSSSKNKSIDDPCYDYLFRLYLEYFLPTVDFRERAQDVFTDTVLRGGSLSSPSLLRTSFLADQRDSILTCRSLSILHLISQVNKW